MGAWWLLGAVFGSARVLGCSCQPELPSDDDPPPPDPTGETASEPTGDTAPPPGPCPQEEVEPNDEAPIGTPIALEQRVCGLVNDPGDSDWYTFEHADDGWLAVEVRAADGSIADPALVLTGDGWSAQRADDPEATDVRLVFPAPAGEVGLLVSEQRGDGGERYGYTALVSEAKPPVSWSAAEVEPNDDDPTATDLAIGATVYGTLDGNGPLPDFDWYRVTIPAGRRTLDLAVIAYAEGSAANLTVRLYDTALGALPPGCRDPCPQTQPGCVDCAIESGATAADLDPLGAYASAGGEVVYVQVLEAGGREGPSYWYTLTVTDPEPPETP